MLVHGIHSAGYFQRQTGDEHAECLLYPYRQFFFGEAFINSAYRLHGLRVGTVADPEFIRLGEFLARALERHPLIEIELQSEVSGAAFEAVRDGALDASFYFGDAPGREVAALALTEVVYRVAGPVAWKPRIERAGWAAIAAMPWIVTPPISTHHRLVHALFGERGVEPSKVVEADNESVISNLIESGVGLSLLREDLARAKQAAGEVCVWPPARLSTTLWFIWLAERRGDPLIAALGELLQQTWHAAPEQAAPPQEPAQI